MALLHIVGQIPILMVEKKTMLIENGALFRADNYHFPTEVWSVKDQVWKPYKGKVPKPVGWGDVISEADAEEFKKPF